MAGNLPKLLHLLNLVYLHAPYIMLPSFVALCFKVGIFKGHICRANMFIFMLEFCLAVRVPIPGPRTHLGMEGIPCAG